MQFAPAYVGLNRGVWFALVVCYIALLISPLFGILACLLALPLVRIRPRNSAWVFGAVWMSAVSIYLFYGGDNHFPEPASFQAKLGLWSLSLSLSFPLLLLDRSAALRSIFILSTAVIVYAAVLTSYTVLSDPVLLAQRRFEIPISERITNSPGVLNGASLAAGFILLFGVSRVRWLAVATVLALSIVMQNRTGILLMSIFVIFELASRVTVIRAIEVFFFLAAVAGGIFLIAAISTELDIPILEATATRFQEEGLASERWEVQAEGLRAVAANSKPFGGYQLTMGSTGWFHNAVLDAYRVSGWLGACALAIAWLMSALAGARAGVRSLVLVMGALVIQATSTTFEGSPPELIVTTYLLFLPFLLEDHPSSPRAPQGHSQIRSAG